MNATSVAVDLAKNVFELAVANAEWRIIERHRLTRAQFERWFTNRACAQVVMEACGSAHHWARWLSAKGLTVCLLPPKYVRPYVKRNKTDAADAAALLEALRCAEVVPVRVKSLEQQALQALHRTRSLWMATRTSRLNALRGFCREFGITITAGARVASEQIARVLADPDSAIPALLRETMRQLLDEVHHLEVRIATLERQLTAAARENLPCQNLLSVPGIGLLTATAMVAATGGSVAHFKSARHFASWFGLTPRENSSGSSRKLGRISKRGDRYLRMLLTHGARSVLRTATVGRQRGKELDPLRAWALAVQARSNHNKAACALANKLARICFATLRDLEPFDSARTARKIARQTYSIAA